MSDQRHDAVSRRAYELWEQEGGEHGRHEDHWHRAADEVDKGEGNASGGNASGGDTSGNAAATEEPVNVTAPDGTTLPVPTAVEAEDAAAQAPAGSTDALDAEPADAPSAKPTRRRAAAKPAEPVDSPAATTPKAAAKPRKSKAK